ncbi:MAG: efflux transporter outer membrane subunit [Betaproteobacteria bacterium]|nr:efflux transporter outer membrane subunit [Betaproteobacteria bacterium]
MSMRVPIAMMAALLAGCTAGPDYLRPSVETPGAYKEGFDWKPAQPRDDARRGNWWAAFGDPRLDALMARVSISNQTLLAADAQFRQAVALSESARAAWFPTVTATVSETRSRPSATTGPITGVATNKRTIRSLPLSASWEADLWGKVRRSVESGEATAQASAADLENARLSIQAQLAQDYFQLRGVDAQKQLLETAVAAYVKSLELTSNRYAAGVVPKSDVAQAETQLKSTQAQAVELGVQRALLEHAIAVLLGRPPSGSAIEPAPLATAPPPVPVGLPAELLERRPDIAAAERRVAAANAQIGIAQSAFFPSATLSATYGVQSATAAQWFTLPSRFWSVGPALAETVFDAGRRRAASDQAIAAYDASVANYRQTVLTAFREVEDNLATLRILEQEAQLQAEAVTAAQQSLEYSINQYKAGIVTYLQVVTAQATVLANQRGAADVLARRVTASVQLVKALGGGWDAADLPAAEKLTGRAAAK